MANDRDQNGYLQAKQAVRFLRKLSPDFPRIGIVLGSGFQPLATHLTSPVTIPYRRISHFPLPTVEGHEGKVHLGRWKKVPVALLAGRVHLYEGYSPSAVVFATRVLALAGVRTLILTCAAGGISPLAAPGSLMAFSDHMNFQGVSPLAGPHDRHWGQRFVDLSNTYDPRLRRIVIKAAETLRIRCFEGVYAATLGPNYETPAEIRALRRLGADSVGMSTVCEATAARQLNMRVLAVAHITNRAAGITKRPLCHEEVIAVGNRTVLDLAHLFDRILPNLAD